MKYSHRRVSCEGLPLQWRHNERDCVSNHWRHDYILNCFFRRRSGTENIKAVRVTGLCEGNSPVMNSPHKGSVTRKMLPFDDCHHAENKACSIALYIYRYIYIYCICEQEEALYPGSVHFHLIEAAFSHSTKIEKIVVYSEFNKIRNSSTC